ncbi:MAG: hypothetical protein A3H59_01105 [Candidatus Jacksonbacteria bacterium RIFCSPLOWO2_02_FULL_43_9]|nr:MAG: hypothetical protein A3B94_01575 [Candidatus Jacksonbacteria bacterium RIFCSPHIGHO2_02_FULL_43_10]OGY70516.1 MAG: hypothetical protein A2986_02210 [Candidatus Jacksonbacteria bacterium RIFCSPLOWO2_01_FULL_44_13]OGY74240.1 MAG: hypothetical protein A3H59_01105 [Candidatus Jacksonbacteria bacterium RIFCSPLOWO2_02_FULL_43_9]HAZ16453.1 hypothetical protein [Candidatus Jacksonbacteria bacterium]HLD19882.1 hypothetical protein [Patescibacteria group bacterium]
MGISTIAQPSIPHISPLSMNTQGLAAFLLITLRNDLPYWQQRVPICKREIAWALKAYLEGDAPRPDRTTVKAAIIATYQRGNRGSFNHPSHLMEFECVFNDAWHQITSFVSVSA